MAFFTRGSEALGPEVKEGFGGKLDPKELCNSNNSNNSNNSSNINTASTSKAKITKKKKKPEPCASEEHFKAGPTVVIDRDGKQYVVPCPPDKADMEPSVVAFVERFVNDIPVILELELVLPRVGKAVAQQTQYMKSLTREEQIDTLETKIKNMDEVILNLDYSDKTNADNVLADYEKLKKELDNTMSHWELQVEELENLG